MEDLKYYEDLYNKFLLAHDKKTEFFVKFSEESKQWEDCNISFMQFKHDYNFREISKEKASKITGGILPEKLFSEYLSLINNNLGLDK